MGQGEKKAFLECTLQPLLAQDKWTFLCPKGRNTCPSTMRSRYGDILQDAEGMSSLGVLPLSKDQTSIPPDKMAWIAKDTKPGLGNT